MGKVLKIIGAIVFSVVMYAVPVLWACSIAYNWNAFWRLIFSIIAAGQLCMLATFVITEAEDDE